MLDSSYGALTDQSTFYVEISRARDRAVVLIDNAEELVKVLADNTGERPTAIKAVDAPLELEPEEIVRLLAEEGPVWTPHAEWEALERRARREGTVLFLVDGYGELIGGARCQRRLKIRPKGGAKDCHLSWWSDLGVRLGVGDAVRGFFRRERAAEPCRAQAVDRRVGCAPIGAISY